MKVFRIILFFAIFMGSAAPADALIDLFTIYNKRNRTIDEIIMNTLDTPENRWQRIRAPINEDYKSWCAYAPKGEVRGDEKIQFRLHEFHYAKHPKIHTLNDIYVAEQELAETEQNSGITEKSDVKGAVTRKRLFNKVLLVSKNENTICYEKVTLSSEQDGIKTEGQKDIFGKYKGGEISYTSPEKINEVPLAYLLYWTIDLGGGEFRRYSYWLEGKNPTQEEKTYLIQLFQYMENQIKNVPS